MSLVDHHIEYLRELLDREETFRDRLLAVTDSKIKALKDLIADTEGLQDGSVDLTEIKRLSDSIENGEDDEPIAASGSKPSKKKGAKKKVAKKKAAKKTVKSKVQAMRKIKSPTSKPRLIDAMQVILKNKTMGAVAIYTELKRLNWLPMSRDPLGYVRFQLSSSGDIFLRKKGARGNYYLDPSNPFYSGKGVPKPSQSRSAKSTSGKAKVSTSKDPKAKKAKASTKVSPPSVSEPPPPISSNHGSTPAAVDHDSATRLVEELIAQGDNVNG